MTVPALDAASSLDSTLADMDSMRIMRRDRRRSRTPLRAGGTGGTEGARAAGAGGTEGARAGGAAGVGGASSCFCWGAGRFSYVRLADSASGGPVLPILLSARQIPMLNLLNYSYQLLIFSHWHAMSGIPSAYEGLLLLRLLKAPACWPAPRICLMLPAVSLMLPVAVVADPAAAAAAAADDAAADGASTAAAKLFPLAPKGLVTVVVVIVIQSSGAGAPAAPAAIPTESNSACCGGPPADSE